MVSLDEDAGSFNTLVEFGRIFVGNKTGDDKINVIRYINEQKTRKRRSSPDCKSKFENVIQIKIGTTINLAEHIKIQ